jgi:hypothetical protein
LQPVEMWTPGAPLLKLMALRVTRTFLTSDQKLTR